MLALCHNLISSVRIIISPFVQDINK